MKQNKYIMEIVKNRTKALKWFNKLGLGEQFYKTMKNNHLITGDYSRHPNSLTGREIELIYNAEHEQPK